MNAVDMALFTAWLPARPNQDVDRIIKIVGPTASALVKDWAVIAQSLIRKGLSITTQSGRVDDDRSPFVLTIRLATKPFASMGSGCDVLVYLTGTHPEWRRMGLQHWKCADAKTDDQGRFTITDVPPGTYKLVVWHPYIRTQIERTVTIGSKGTVEAHLSVRAPTGRLYANEVLEHGYVRYSVTKEQKKEIELMIHKQEH
jgi:hypothetical protein